MYKRRAHQFRNFSPEPPNGHVKLFYSHLTLPSTQHQRWNVLGVSPVPRERKVACASIACIFRRGLVLSTARNQTFLVISSPSPPYFFIHAGVEAQIVECWGRSSHGRAGLLEPAGL